MNINETAGIPSSTEEFIKHYEIQKIHYDFLDRLMFVISTAFGLLAAFAWDDIFHILFAKLFDHLGEPMTKLTYAISLTLLAAIMALVFKKISTKRRKKRMSARL